jgi:BASS family bile acid:Na+ symporter
MIPFLTIALKISLVVFMAGNLLEMGLRLRLSDALVGLRDVRFVAHSLLWCFVLCPALAVLLTTIIPLAPPYAMGLLLLGMAPCAPFLPVVVARARGDTGYTASFMLMAAVGTILFMPIAVPLLVKGLSVSAWLIAKPLLMLVLAPLVIGMAVFHYRPAIASRLAPGVRRITAVTTVIMLILLFVIYGKGFLGAVGSYAIGTQMLYIALITVGSYVLGIGLRREQKCVLGLGVCTRNAGAAIAPLFTSPGVDERAIIMVGLVVPIMVVAALIAAWRMAGGPAAPATTTAPASPSEPATIR